MTNFQKLKHEARRAEQRSNWARAIELYKEAIRLTEAKGGSAFDLGIYNRVGDLYLRQGNTSAAVEYYERAVDLYAAHDLKTSAIALCNKILRIAPQRDSVYRTLGKLHASTGLLAEARSSYLEFAGRMVEQEKVSDAVEAVQEFVDLTEDEEIRTLFADRLADRGHKAQATAQLRLSYESRVGRGGAAEEIRERILAIDPAADPLSPEAASGPAAPAADPLSPEAASGPAAPAAQEEGETAVARPAPGPAGQAPAGPARSAFRFDASADRPSLARLVAAELHGEDVAKVFDPDAVSRRGNGDAAPGRPGSTPDRGQDFNQLLRRFRSKVRHIVADTDYGAHYDLGVAYLGMGLLDEALEELQQASTDPGLLPAAHAMIRECLRRQGVLPRPSLDAETGEPPAVGQEGSGQSLPARLGVPSAAGVPAQPTERPEESVEASAEPEGPAVEPLDTPDGLDTAAPAPEADSSAEAEAAEARRREDVLAELLFKARLAQYRARQAQGENRTDHQAHLELGLAYLEMELYSEATRELETAAKGPGSVAARAAAALERVAARLGTGLDTGAQAAAGPPETTQETSPTPQSPAPTRTAEAPGTDPITELARIEEELEVDDGEATPGAAAPPPDAEAAYSAALKLLEQGRVDEAIGRLYQVLELFERQRKIRRALDVVDRLLELNPEDVVLHHQRAEFAIMTNDRGALIHSYLELASCLRRQNAASSARTVYGRVLDIDPDNAEARTGISEVDDTEIQRELARRSDTARSRAGEAKAPGLPGSRPTGPGGTKGASDDEVGPLDFDAMLEELREELPGGPETADANSRFELGLAFRQMAMWDEAIRELQAALPGLENPLPAYEVLGESFIALEKYGVARKVLGRAETLLSYDDADMKGVLYYLGIACQQEDDEAAAQEYLERVCSVDMGYRDAAERLSALSS